MCVCEKRVGGAGGEGVDAGVEFFGVEEETAQGWGQG